MTPELIGIVAVGAGLGTVAVGLAGLMLVLFQMTNRRIDLLEQRFDWMDQRIRQRFESLEGRISAYLGT